MWFSKGVDVSVAVICLVLADVAGSVSELASLQFAFTMQIFPIFITGLYSRDPKPVPLFWGCVVGIATVGYFAIEDEGVRCSSLSPPFSPPCFHPYPSLTTLPPAVVSSH